MDCVVISQVSMRAHDKMTGLMTAGLSPWYLPRAHAALGPLVHCAVQCACACALLWLQGAASPSPAQPSGSSGANSWLPLGREGRE